ncbi:hypothetical protein ACP70R_040791 [Stipagrostis hirtigluma subsp. patula]
MAASLGLNPEAFFTSYSYTSPFLADYEPSLPAAPAVDTAFSCDLDDHLEHSQAPIFSGAGGDDDHNEKKMDRIGSDEKTMGARAKQGRIGFRTRSEVEILDDGFKWRKYGKKAVKNSPNPRNYYRCSAEGCGVKKRVERDRDDPRYVITTYDGVHNHHAAVIHYGAFYSSPSPPAASSYSGSRCSSDIWAMT